MASVSSCVRATGWCRSGAGMPGQRRWGREAGAKGHLANRVARVGEHAPRRLKAQVECMAGGCGGEILAKQPFQPARRESEGAGDGAAGSGASRRASIRAMAAATRGSSRGSGAGVLICGSAPSRAVVMNEAATCSASAGPWRAPIRCSIRSAAGGRAPGGEAAARQHETVGQHVDLRMGGRQILQILPMHRGAVAVEQSRPRQHPGARIDPPDRAKARRHAAQAADQRTRGDLGLPEARDHHQRVGPFGRVEWPGGGQLDPAGQRHRRAVGRDDAPAEGLGPEVAVGRAQRIEDRGHLEDRRLRQDQGGQRERLAGGGEDRCAFRHVPFVKRTAWRSKSA